MSEHNGMQDIGSLAGEFARLKEQVSGVDERVERAHRAFVAAAISFPNMVVQDDRLTLVGSDEQTRAELENLPGKQELVDLFNERTRLRAELEGVRVKLREWLVKV